ncbi:DUF3164 family protein [Polymorphum gilvum]|uniref:Conserved hypothetical phage protein n=1 Tax=Polymorphum gilvum (strain LMG 25793 / CGMCC 1.9160 / SL003B-26A1) TaxID=991905 RepID=F2J659_POLGS|nr:DUF3164 family protein [Polymorphum gilvum]ADZ72423.1 Conserved hypothetical phage protein [Polymorphum gilvum SL003B-26A1]
MNSPETRAAAGGVIDVNGRPYMADAKGKLVPLELIKAQDKLEDEVVRKIMRYSEELSAQIERFKGHTFTDLGEFDALLQEVYGQTRGGIKGNRTYQTVDGCMRVSVQVADFIDFGPQLQIAKALIDECLNEWSADARPEIRGIITRAFNTDREGQINRSEIFMLLRLEIEDARWNQAMEAIRDAMRITGSKTYVRFHKRDRPDGKWEPVTIDLAKVA